MLKLPFGFTPEEIISQGRTTQGNIDIIKIWLSSLKDNVIPEVQDEMIVIFLLSCENDIPLTKNTITMYYQCKRDGPELFDDRDMERDDIKRCMNTIRMSSIPVRTDENYVVHYFKLKDTNYKNFDLVPAMKVSYMLLDITQERNLPRGLVVIIDMKGAGIMHLTRLKMNPLKTYLQFLQEGFPIQMKVIHIVNAVYFIDKMINLVKVFIKSELMKMLCIHLPSTSQEELFALVPKKCWPQDYGGDLPSADELHAKTIQQFIEKQEFWKIEQAIRNNHK